MAPKFRITLILLAIMILRGARLCGDDRPSHLDYSGAWKLNLQKTNVGPFPVQKELLLIRTIEGNIEVAVFDDERLIQKSCYIPDGRTRLEHNGEGDSEVKARWDDFQLVVQRHYLDAQKPSWENRWSLSGDGKVLTREGDFTFVDNERLHVREVFDKQPEDEVHIPQWPEDESTESGTDGVAKVKESGMSEGKKRVAIPDRLAERGLDQRVDATYPQLALLAHVQGDVLLQARIGTDGTVQELEMISGHPLLVPSAMEAVRQWKYKPLLWNGRPVEMETQIVVHFRFDTDGSGAGRRSDL